MIIRNSAILHSFSCGALLVLLLSHPCRFEDVSGAATKTHSRNDSLKMNSSSLDSPEQLDTTTGVSRYYNDASDRGYVIHQSQGLPPQIAQVYDKPRASEKLTLASQIIAGATATMWLHSYIFAQAAGDKNAKIYLGSAAVSGLLFIWSLSF